MIKLKDKIIPDIDNSDMVNWNNMKYMIDNEMNVTYKEISLMDSEIYKGNLYGLFKNKFNIDPRFIYIHIIINGYKSSIEYKGDKRRFKIIETEALLNAFNIL